MEDGCVYPDAETEIELCCVCLDAETEIELQPCLHLCLCFACVLKFDLKSLDCPLCRTRMKRFYARNALDNSRLLNAYIDTYCLASDELSKLVMHILKHCDPTIDKRQLLIAIQVACDFFDEKLYLSVEQTEALLTLCANRGLDNGPNGYYMHHGLVQLCNKPWRVDPALGRSGVCYHGYMGGTPALFAALYNFRAKRNIVSCCFWNKLVFLCKMLFPFVHKNKTNKHGKLV